MADEEIVTGAQIGDEPTALTAAQNGAAEAAPVGGDSLGEPLTSSTVEPMTNEPPVVEPVLETIPVEAPAAPITAASFESSEFTEVAALTEKIYAEVHKAVVGQTEVLEAAVAGLLANGHVLLEGVPGTAKTLLVRALAASIATEYGRIQFTPDLMPSDVTGTRIYDMQKGEFYFRKGPVFTGLLLADEINRTPPKTQAALLEAMQERQVTIDGEPFALPPLFMVFATQNPVEFEGTYVLPEAQLDRFLLKVRVAYPSQDDEQVVLRRYHTGFDAAELGTAAIVPVATTEEIIRCRATIAKVKVEDALFKYITGLVASTRSHRQIVLGASPRASIALLQVSKALAAMRGRDFCIPDDIKSIAPAVLRHRLILRPDAEIEGITADQVVEDILDQLEVPR